MIIVLLLMGYIVLRSAPVQTWLTHRISSYYSDKLGATVTVGGVDVSLFKKIDLDDVYISDRHNDTLLYSNEMKFDIGKFNYKKKQLHFNDIDFTNLKFNMVKYKSDSSFNFEYLVDAFSSNDTTTVSDTAKGKGWHFSVGGLTLDNAAFLLQDKNDTSTTTGINFSDMYVHNINTQISDIMFIGDTLRASVDYLSAEEKSGFTLKNFSSYVKLSSVGMELDELNIETPETDLSTDLVFKYKHFGDFKDFVNKVWMKAKFDKSYLEMNDIAYFAPALDGIHKRLNISGVIYGRINDLKAKDMDILFGKSSEFNGNVDINGLPDMAQTFIHLNINRLTTTRSDLDDIPIPPFTQNNTLEVPQNIGLLGKIQFRGDFSGFFTDFVAFGDFSTDLGEVSTDIAIQQGKDINYSGKIKANNFNIGKFLGLEQYLGNISIDAKVKGSGLEKDKVNANLDGTVENIVFNNYNYQNVKVGGTLAKKVFNGNLSIADKNINLLFNGDIDFNQKVPALDFKAGIKNANLGALGFLKDTTETKGLLSSCMNVSVQGNNVDNILGKIRVDSTIYILNKKRYHLDNLLLTATRKDTGKILKLTSDYADATVDGVFTMDDLVNSFNNLLSNYLPTHFKNEDKDIETDPQNFTYYVVFNDNDTLTNLLLPGLQIAPGTFLKGKFNSTHNSFGMEGISPEINYKGKHVKYWSVDATGNAKKLNVNMGFKEAALSNADSVWMQHFNMDAIAAHDSINYMISWQNNKQNNGQLDGFYAFLNKDSSLFKVLPSSHILLADSTWKIKPENNVVFDTSGTHISHFEVYNNHQGLKIDGDVTHDPKSTLSIILDHFNLADLNPMTRGSQITFSGTINGATDMSGFYKNFLFSSGLDFKRFAVNNELLGDGSINSFWDHDKNAISINGALSRGIIDQETNQKVNNLQLSGEYYPSRKKDNIDLSVALKAIHLDVFRRFVKDYCSIFNGQFSGHAKITGELDKPIVNGKLNVFAKKIRINYLNTDYTFNSEVDIAPNSFGVNNMHVYDADGNLAMVTGHLFHTNFKDFQLDFDVNAKDFQCLNTNETQNNLYYGKAYMTGIINFFGFMNNIQIDAAVKTEKGTKFNIPLSTPSEVDQHDYISFVKKDTGVVKTDTSGYKVDLGGMQMNFDIDATPDAEVQMIFDSKVGDVIRGRGSGNIKLAINTLGNFNMYGDYNISSGDYLFTLKNIINKKFTLEKGGTIKWTGDPYDADINISAVYKLRTALYPFFPTDSTQIYKKRYPVDCKLMMTNKLLTPTINFDIDLPTVDDNTKQTIKNYLSTPEEMNQQVFSLLVLHSFITPAALRGQGVASVNSANAGASNTTELLSNQLSNWLSQISKDFDIGVNYRPGDNITSKELEVALSTQLFNDRMSIEGNVGVTGNTPNQSSTTQNTNNIVGDVDVEYKISKDGKLRVKAFNKPNDNTIITTNSSSNSKQGVGIFYREEFNTVKGLYYRYLNKINGKKNKKKTSK